MFIKRTLTTMQITQFVVGGSYTMVHSFVSYVVPVIIPSNAAAAAAAAPVGSPAANALDSIRQLVFGDAANKAAAASANSSETIHVAQPCIVTAGETFAIWLNVLYLAPLTYLFVSFFVASYVKRSNAASKMNGKADRRPSNVHLAEKAGWDAARGVEREVYGGENMVGGGSAAVTDDLAAAPAKKSGKSRKRV
jgi:hypothetical protein